MLTPEIKAQVEAVLRARQLEDKAYRAVMAIDHNTPMEEVERLAAAHAQAHRTTDHEEQWLVALTMKAVEAVAS